MVLLRRLRQSAVAVTAITVSSTVSAQDMASVTVAPLAAGAPALGWPGLAVLAIALAVGAVLMLRRSRPLVGQTLGLVTLALTAGVGDASQPAVIISGAECHQVTEKSFQPLKSLELESECSNPIRIVALTLNCEGAEGEAPAEPVSDSPCEVGLIIPAGGSCHLPSCPC
jgi:hypothetical protein